MPRALIRLAAALMLVVASTAALAEAWPTRPIRVIVCYPPGGVTDVVARLIAQPLSAALGQSIVVENKPGANGMIGSQIVADSAPDGYTLLMYVDGNTVLPSIMKKMPFEPLKAFAPITVLGRGSHVIVVHPSLPVRSLGELIAYARKHPGELSYASPGLASPQSLSLEAIKKASGIDIVHIPYKGGGQAIADVAGGQVKLGVLGMAPTLPHIQSGKLIALAVTGGRRSELLPNVPTVAEAALPGFETVQWQGIAAPAGTPTEIVGRIHDELVRIMATPPVVERLKSIGMDNSTSATPDDFRTLIDTDLHRWPAIVKAAGIEPE
ncbi:MAG: tripartite tricarboxylate transporter substrate binding protein [Proteobacteria bacterium]|nr:tripartite tricarboxylate transporter substrate binding protein [Pseudomonadota bacterium]